MKKRIRVFLKKYNKILVIFTVAIILTLLFGGTYAVFQKIDENNFANNYRTGDLQIEFDEPTGIINLEGAVPTSEENIDSLPSYNLKITNYGNLNYKFDLKLVTHATYVESHGCADNQISPNYIKIKINDRPSVLLSELTDNIIDEGITLNTDESIMYEIKVWLAEGTPNTEIGKHYHAKVISNGNAIHTSATEPNAPLLASGMIPITYNGQTWVKASTSASLDSTYRWYDYNNKQWANATMVKTLSETNTTLSDGTACTGTNNYCSREDYMNAEEGVNIPEEDILAYYVWIPRYKYQLDYEGELSYVNIEFESGTASTGNVRCQTNDIGIETCTNQESGNWYTHPAFTFNGLVQSDGLTGIWVGKFETGYGTNLSGYPNNTVYANPTIKPYVTSLRNQNISTQFQTAQYFGTSAYLTTDGVNEVDAHMMKNIEWGAVAYLSRSIYGIGYSDPVPTESYSAGFITGCAKYDTYGVCSYEDQYTSEYGQEMSTTGNVTGVFDMVGGAYEYVMGVIQDDTTTGRSPLSGSSTFENSGYIGKYYWYDEYVDIGNTLAFPDAKYYDLYANAIENTEETRGHLGDASCETNWRCEGFPTAEYPWFVRSTEEYYNGLFNYSSGSGTALTDYGFRSVLAPFELYSIN